MKNKEILNKCYDLKQTICDYIAQIIGGQEIELDWEFQDINISQDTDNPDIPLYHVSKVFIEDGNILIEMEDRQYAGRIEQSFLVDESIDVVIHMCELIEDKVLEKNKS